MDNLISALASARRQKQMYMYRSREERGLIDASRKGDSAKVTRLLQEKADPDQSDWVSVSLRNTPPQFSHHFLSLFFALLCTPLPRSSRSRRRYLPSPFPSMILYVKPLRALFICAGWDNSTDGCRRAGLCSRRLGTAQRQGDIARTRPGITLAHPFIPIVIELELSLASPMFVSARSRSGLYINVSVYAYGICTRATAPLKYDLRYSIRKHIFLSACFAFRIRVNVCRMQKGAAGLHS